MKGGKTLPQQSIDCCNSVFPPFGEKKLNLAEVKLMQRNGVFFVIFLD